MSIYVAMCLLFKCVTSFVEINVKYTEKHKFVVDWLNIFRATFHIINYETTFTKVVIHFSLWILKSVKFVRWWFHDTLYRRHYYNFSLFDCISYFVNKIIVTQKKIYGPRTISSCSWKHSSFFERPLSSDVERPPKWTTHSHA